MMKEHTALRVLEENLDRVREQKQMEQEDVRANEEFIERARLRIEKCEEREKELLAAIELLERERRS
ncbi:hypothetical protein [Bhargavaea ginsengi]|uniref:hypothetical protein n=1 Tax=Bhargavaea ginsengi TaxID=426757 RepID=UPI003C75E58C